MREIGPLSSCVPIIADSVDHPSQAFLHGQPAYPLKTALGVFSVECFSISGNQPPYDRSLGTLPVLSQL